MKNRAFIIILAVLLAVCGSAGVFLYVRSADSRAIAGQQAVTVLVAKERIPAGTTAEEVMKLVDKQQMPKSTVPENTMSELDTAIVDLVTSSEIGSTMNSGHVECVAWQPHPNPPVMTRSPGVSRVTPVPVATTSPAML